MSSIPGSNSSLGVSMIDNASFIAFLITPLDTPSTFGYMGIKDPVSLSSSISANFSIVGFLNSIDPVFLISGFPERATSSPSLNLDSIY